MSDRLQRPAARRHVETSSDDLAAQRSPTRSRASCVAVTRGRRAATSPDCAVPAPAARGLAAAARRRAGSARIEDVVPDERFEPDAGPEPDVDQLRERLADAARGPSTTTPRSFDPYVARRGRRRRGSPTTSPTSPSDLAHGLQHYRAGRVAEALWWWQFSLPVELGCRRSAPLRALQSLVAHVRLDADDDVASTPSSTRLHRLRRSTARPTSAAEAAGATARTSLAAPAGSVPRADPGTATSRQLEDAGR